MSDNVQLLPRREGEARGEAREEDGEKWRKMSMVLLHALLCALAVMTS
jgi:hypothetical protein